MLNIIRKIGNFPYKRAVALSVLAAAAIVSSVISDRKQQESEFVSLENQASNALALYNKGEYRLARNEAEAVKRKLTKNRAELLRGNAFDFTYQGKAIYLNEDCDLTIFAADKMLKYQQEQMFR